MTRAPAVRLANNSVFDIRRHFSKRRVKQARDNPRKPQLLLSALNLCARFYIPRESYKMRCTTTEAIQHRFWKAISYFRCLNEKVTSRGRSVISIICFLTSCSCLGALAFPQKCTKLFVLINASFSPLKCFVNPPPRKRVMLRLVHRARKRTTLFLPYKEKLDAISSATSGLRKFSPEIFVPLWPKNSAVVSQLTSIPLARWLTTTSAEAYQ